MHDLIVQIDGQTDIKSDRRETKERLKKRFQRIKMGLHV